MMKIRKAGSSLERALSKGIASQEASRQRHLGSHDGKTGSAVRLSRPRFIETERTFFLDRRKKQKEIFFTGFCVTLILAAALGAFLCVDNTLSAAGFDGGGFARSALSLWDHAEQWVGAHWRDNKNRGGTDCKFSETFFSTIGKFVALRRFCAII